MAAKDINKRIAAEISWSHTDDRTARTCPAREKFLQRFEREVDPRHYRPTNAAAVPNTPNAPTCSASPKRAANARKAVGSPSTLASAGNLGSRSSATHHAFQDRLEPLKRA